MAADRSSSPAMVGSRPSLVTAVVLVMLVVYWSALFYGTHTTIPPGTLPGHSDKVIHFIAYAGLAVLLITLRATRGPYPWYSVVFRWIFLAIYGAFDEATQMLVNRSADLHDWYADMIGATMGFGLFTVIYWYWRNPRRQIFSPAPANDSLPH